MCLTLLVDTVSLQLAAQGRIMIVISRGLPNADDVPQHGTEVVHH